MACDALGRSVRFLLAAGQGHNILTVPALLDGQRPAAGAYDANSLRAYLDHLGAKAVIPSPRSRKAPIAHDAIIYKLRKRIECCFNKFRHFRPFATRYDRLATHYLAFPHIAATMI